MAKIFKDFEVTPKGLIIATVAIGLFWLGAVAGHAGAPKRTPVLRSVAVDTPRTQYIPLQNLTLQTCETETECYIATALDRFNNATCMNYTPVLDPLDCGGTGKAKAVCERANKRNAGKPAIYPAVCAPYIWAH